MATISDVIKGLRIMAKYEKDGEEAHIGGAEHDIIFGCTTQPEDMDIVCQAELAEAGWFWSDPKDYGCWCMFV